MNTEESTRKQKLNPCTYVPYKQTSFINYPTKLSSKEVIEHTELPHCFDNKETRYRHKHWRLTS